MTELNVAIQAEQGAVAAAEFKIQESVKPNAAKSNFKFEWFLGISALIIVCIGLYESLTQNILPAYSILSFAHSYGYFKAYPIIYEPSKGIWHELGWLGSFMMVFMMLYSVRKRVSFFSSLGSMRHWLSAHMFLGVMGPLLVTLHTTFKFHGLIATSFWCMITTMVFGILGRYIYVQIPRTISGAELGVKEIDGIVEKLNNDLGRFINNTNITHFLTEITTADEKAKDLHPLKALGLMMWTDIINRFKVWKLRRILKTRYQLSRRIRDEHIMLLKRKAALIRRKNFLTTSHKLLHYWHVLHVPLAIVMFLIMFLHIIVYYVFRVSI